LRTKCSSAHEIQNQKNSAFAAEQISPSNKLQILPLNTADQQQKMPKSKRAKVVHLSKVEKKGKEHTLKTFANVQEAVAKYPYLFVFSVDNMRNQLLKDVRAELTDSRYAVSLRSQ
jgi:hypothetical protein